MAQLVTLAVSPAEIAQFTADGYLHQKAVWSADEVVALRDDLKRTATENAGLVHGAPWVAAEKGARSYLPVRDLDKRSALYGDICRGELLEAAGALLGDAAELYDAVGIIKPPAVGVSFPPHQDGAYYGPIDGRYVIANIYLDDVTPDNGSLRLAPGSHGWLWAHDSVDGKKTLQEADFPVWVEPQAKAGDVVWFHLWAVHASRPNVSRTIRRTVRVGYVGVSA